MFSLTIPLNELSSKNVGKRIKPLTGKGSKSTWACWKSGVVPAMSWGKNWAGERWQYSAKVMQCNGSPLQRSSEASLLHFHDFISYTHSSLFHQDRELLSISSLLGSQVSGIPSLLPLLEEKSLWKKSLVIFVLLLWHLEKNLLL